MDETQRGIGLKMLDIAAVALPDHPRLKAIQAAYATATDEAGRDAVTLDFLAAVFDAVRPPPPKPEPTEPPNVTARKNVRDHNEGRMVRWLAVLKEGGRHTRQEAADMLEAKNFGLQAKTIRDQYMPRVFPVNHPDYGDCWRPGTPSFWGGVPVEFGSLLEPSDD